MGHKLKRRPPQGDSSDQLVQNLADWAAILARHQRIFGIGAEHFMNNRLEYPRTAYTDLNALRFLSEWH
jgi:hypothetical protein